MVAMPMAAIKHLLHEERNNLGGEKQWNGHLTYRGQNAPTKPEGFSYVSEEVLQKKVVEAHKHVSNHQPNKHGRHVDIQRRLEHWNCNCGCDSCKNHCAERPEKKAEEQRQYAETHANLRKEFEKDIEKARYEMANNIGGMTQETAARVVLGAVMVRPAKETE